jgi:hypothetical protein
VTAFAQGGDIDAGNARERILPRQDKQPFSSAASDFDKVPTIRRNASQALGNQVIPRTWREHVALKVIERRDTPNINTPILVTAFVELRITFHWSPPYRFPSVRRPSGSVSRRLANRTANTLKRFHSLSKFYLSECHLGRMINGPSA